MTTLDATQSVVVEREFSHSVDKVWRALTDGSLMEEWLLKNDFQPAVGRRFTFRSKPMPHWDGLVNCVVLVVEPEQRLVYSWNVGDPGVETSMKTVVTWTLKPTADGVLVRMEQAGFRADQEPNRQGAEYGWQRFFGNLEKVLERSN